MSWPAVHTAFPSFSVRFEGTVNCMYLDRKGFVTTGIGCLIDPVSSALRLPFVHKADGKAASQSEITAEWVKLKGAPGLAKAGWRAAAIVTRLTLTPSDVVALLVSRMADNERVLVDRFPTFEQMPADAQLALHSMAWACGDEFRFPRLEAALAIGDYTTAATESHMDDEDNPGLVGRNVANRALFLSAARVVSEGMDPSVLLYARTTEPDLAAVDSEKTIPYGSG